MRFRAVLLALLSVVPTVGQAQTMADAPLALEGRIPLGDIAGRLDHLAVDLKRQRLYVAELGNGTLGVVDLAAGKVLQTVGGFREPQGVGYEPSTDTIYVANGGEGSVRVLRAADLAPIARIEIGEDADNVRVDQAHQRVLVGYGNGGLAVIDPATGSRVGDFPLNGHPEGFQIGRTANRVFINVPRRAEIVVIDLAQGAMRSLPTGGLRSNFPMAIDADADRVLTVFRNPPSLMAFSTDGTVTGRIETCGDADDVFLDRKRHRIYVICGAGAIDVIDGTGTNYQRLASLPTAPGARTALFVPELDRLYVAAAANGASPAALWVFRPLP